MWINLKPSDKEIIKHLGLLTQLGLTVISSILILFFLFLYLDKRFETNGILMAVGIVLGVVTGVYSAYRILKKFYEKS